MGKKKFLEKLVFVKWKDSYGVDTGWKDISEYSASLLEIKSLGKVIYEDKEIISLAQNFSDETDYNPEQAKRKVPARSLNLPSIRRASINSLTKWPIPAD